MSVFVLFLGYVMGIQNFGDKESYYVLVEWISNNDLVIPIKIYFILFFVTSILYLIIQFFEFVNVFSKKRKSLNKEYFEFDYDEKKFNFNVKNFQGINNIQFEFPLNLKWVFLTGNNGIGKTNIIQALVRVLSNSNDERIHNGMRGLDPKSYISLNVAGKNRILTNKPRDTEKISYRIMAFGTNRLDMGGEFISKEYTTCQGMFDTQMVLRDFNVHGLSRWYFQDRDKFDDCIEKFKKLMPSLDRVTVDKNYKVFYHEKDSEGNDFPPVEFKDLASGLKNIIAMVGNIIMNLTAPITKYEKIETLDKLKAFVFIDEFELFLHPILQKKLPKILSEIFPNVHFIVSTHSPLPLLGAPRNSAFIKVNRSQNKGITIYRMDEKIDINELMPNTVLTSPLFEMEDIFAKNYQGKKKLRLEDSFEELNISKSIDARIEDFVSDSYELELIERYKNKKRIDRL